jgi:hypothetical protein
MIVDKKNRWKFKYVLVKEQVWTQKCAVQKASVNVIYYIFKSLESAIKGRRKNNISLWIVPV